MKRAKIALALVAFVAAATMAARAQTSVFVPGNTNGGFGNPIDTVVPLVPAITVSGPSKITITYISGTVTDAAGMTTRWTTLSRFRPSVTGYQNRCSVISLFVQALKPSARISAGDEAARRGAAYADLVKSKTSLADDGRARAEAAVKEIETGPGLA